MERIGDMLWEPWLVYLAFGFGVAATVWNGVPQLRGWVRFVRDRPRYAGVTSRVAVATGLGGLAGTVVAVATGGPGALFWLTVTMLLGLAVHGAEGLVAGSAKDPAADRSVDDVAGLVGVARRDGRGSVAIAVAVSTVVAAVIVGGLLQVHQAAQLFHETFSVLPLATGISIAVLLALLNAFPSGRRRLLELAPWVVGAYLVACAVWLGQDTWGMVWALEQVWSHAFQLRPAAAGFIGSILTVAVAHGVWAGTLATQSGLGVSAMALTDPARSPAPASPPHAAMVGAFLGGAMALGTGLVVLVDPSPDANLIEDRTLLPLERPSSRGLRPNPEVGQVIVLPEDGRFEDGKTYSMVLRSNPRGHAWPARLVTEGNYIQLPNLQILQNVETVVFRAKDETLAKNPAWDVRVAVRLSTESIKGKELLRLDPVDESVSLEKLIEQYELSPQPHLVVDDFEFYGRVGYAQAQGLGRHLGMFEDRRDDAPTNPKLHEFFRTGYRGPYAASSRQRTPWAMVADETFQADPGTVLPLRMQSPSRGADLLHVTKDGRLMAPPWDFLADASTVVLRHDEEPAMDRSIAVQPRFDGRRWFFDPPPWMDDWTMVEKLPGYSGPFLLTEPFDFDVEVRSGERFPGQRADRQALIPITDEPEPVGPKGSLPYTPHPGEILATDMEGPVVRRDGARAIVARFVETWGTWGGRGVAILGFLLSVLGAAAWIEFGARAWSALAKARGRWLYNLLFVGACAGAASLSDDVAWGTVRMAVGLSLVPNLLLLFVSFGRFGNRRPAKGA